MKTTPETALALLNEKKYPDAAAAYERLLQTAPQDISLWTNLGTALGHLKHYEAAMLAAARAVEYAPDNPVCLVNYANSLFELNRIDESLPLFEKALRLMPDHFSIRRNYATALNNKGDAKGALEQLDAADKLKPGDGYAEWLRATVLLKAGRLKEGWKAFETRQKLGAFSDIRDKKQGRSIPLWQGEDLAEKTLLLHEEQGVGDTILCSRYIPQVQARGGKIFLACKDTLHRLFSSFTGLELLDKRKPIKTSFDYQAPMMSLPGIFGTDLSSVPPPAPLFIPSALPPEIRRLLDLGKNRFRAGIFWSGNPQFPENHKRAVSLSRFLPFAGLKGVQLYSLQKGPGEEELAAAKAESLILPLGPHLKDYADTAAVLQELDLIIMTDSSVAHLAGTLGRPVWNLLPYHAYWLYLMERNDSPWYPAMRLFRQPSPGDWDSVFTTVRKELEALIVTSRQQT